MKVFKEKQFLVLERPDGKQCKYDFSTKKTIGWRGKEVTSLKSQLKDLSMSELIESCNDKAYGRFLKYVQNRQDYNVSNIGTILSRIPYFAKYEQIFSAGIENVDNDISCNINEIPKFLIKYCRETGMCLSNKLIKAFNRNPDMHVAILNCKYESLTPQFLYAALIYERSNGFFRDGVISYINYMVEQFGYNGLNLVKYLDRLMTYEGIDDYWILREIYDYANMMNQITDKYEKFPRHFLTTHKIATRNYNRFKVSYDEEVFKSVRRDDLEFTYKGYKFIYPQTTQDIKTEGSQMNHCVASYIKQVLDRETHIMFLRDKDDLDKSLVTVQVNPVTQQIVQAKRKFNYSPSANEKEAIEAFNKKFKVG